MELLAAALVSLVTEFVTSKFGMNTIGSLVAYLVVSFVGASVYVFLSATSFWPTLLNVGTYAAAIYAVFVHPITKNS